MQELMSRSLHASHIICTCMNKETCVLCVLCNSLCAQKIVNISILLKEIRKQLVYYHCFRFTHVACVCVFSCKHMQCTCAYMAFVSMRLYVYSHLTIANKILRHLHQFLLPLFHSSPFSQKRMSINNPKNHSNFNTCGNFVLFMNKRSKIPGKNLSKS